MRQAKSSVIALVLYGLGFLLLWEWMRPISQMTDTSGVHVFVWYGMFAFVLTYMRLPYWVSMPAKGIGLYFALHILFFMTSVFDPGAWSYLITDLAHNTRLLFSGSWTDLSDLFRSFLFLVLLWLLSYLMYYWLVQMRRVFLFFLVTVVYVTLVDTFANYDADAAIIRTVIIGFVMLGVARFARLSKGEQTRRFPLPWAGALAVLVAATIVFGLAGPKAGPQWPDPVPFFTSAAQKYQHDEEGGDADSATQRVGYGTNDSHLGGPFQYDDTPVFQAVTKDARYWRVESKDTYTGKGWKNSRKGKWAALDLQDRRAPNLYKAGVHTKKQKAKISFAKGRNFRQLVYGGELTDADMPANLKLELNQRKQKIRTVRHGDPVSARHYGLTFQKPKFSMKALRRRGGPDPETVQKRYLQLPDSLPDRIQKQAKHVTKDEDNRYDKAKAVEQYFHGEEFTYDTEDVAVPNKNQDYASQFMFSTQKGYCDNFSTSMAVMLRTIGIPTRWVKGFTPGDYKKTQENGADVYQVTNANAHSWVEVYFPQAGWVPFEPTKSFSNSAAFVSHYEKQDHHSARAAADADEDTKVDEEDQPQTDPHHQQQRQGDKQSAADGDEANGDHSTGSTWMLWGSLVLLLVMLMIVTGYLTRRKWLPLFIRIDFRYRHDEEVFMKAYERLLRVLPMYGMRRRENETLREYAKLVDQTLGTEEMTALTSSYERALYRGERSAEMWRESKILWETILKKLS